MAKLLVFCRRFIVWFALGLLLNDIFLPSHGLEDSEGVHRYRRDVNKRHSKRRSSGSSEDAEFWTTQAEDMIEERLSYRPNTGVAKNILFFLGDGMSIPTVTATRILQGQLRGETGEENALSFESFPHVSLIKTYNTDAQVSDSAGTATALFCGVKTKTYTTGCDDNVVKDDCLSVSGNTVDSIAVLAEQAGKSIGVVTTHRLTHATPSALYAHTANRNWEYDVNLPDDAVYDGCTDIAAQLINYDKFHVMLGGGRAYFFTKSETDPVNSTLTGLREDGRNLINEWETQHEQDSASVVHTRSQLLDVDVDNTDYLLGLFSSSSHMNYDLDNEDLSEDEKDPSLDEMTQVAMKILSKNPNGYFLMIEGALIDYGHHDGIATYALYDTIAMDKAIVSAKERVTEDDTLFIVTADHSHVMSIGGWPVRGVSIFGIGDIGADDLPYTTLSYANGLGYIVDRLNEENIRPNISNVDTGSRSYLQEATFPADYESHGGDDVSLYSTGPMAHLLTGVQEQSYVMHVMKYAACLGDKRTSSCLGRTSDGSTINISFISMLLIVCFNMLAI